MLKHMVGVLALSLLLQAGAAAQESWAERCQSVQSGAAPGMAEFCRGIAAMRGGDYGGKSDPAAALRHYQRAAAMGFAEAEATLGEIYERGWQQVQRDPAQAAQWYAKAAAQGHAGAELNLGHLYERGEGVPQDKAKARQLIEAAAAQGLAPAKRALAELDGHGPETLPGAALYDQGVARYRAGDHAAAAVLIRQAADAGNPTATYEMGYLYENGDGVPKDPAQSARWYEKGASIGDAASEAAVGLLYEEGQGGLPDDWMAAARWYRKSADQDNRMGEFRLGRAYQYGIGVPLDLSTAVVWYEKAAAQGDSQAAYFANYIRDNHGFDRSSYSSEEQSIMAPYMMQPWMLHPPPAGRVFRNTNERLNYFRSWARAGAAYGACLSRHAVTPAGVGFTCPAPVPPG